MLVEVFLILVHSKHCLSFFDPFSFFVVNCYLYFKDGNLMYHDVTHF